MALLQNQARSSHAQTAEIRYHRQQNSAVCANVYDNYSNEQLMMDYRDGDVEAFTALYHRNKAALYRYFLRQTHSSSFAEELSQDVWTNVIRSRQSYQVNAKFTTYLFQVAHNRLVDHYRKNANKPNPGMVTTEEDCEIAAGTINHPDTQAEAEQIKTRLLSIIGALPEEQREAFVLKEDAGLNLEQIANVTAVNVETAKSRLRYAMKKIREGLKELV